ncbi:MAG: fumarate reductase subunit C [Candidatus Acidiferrales bacterium]
MNGSATYTRHHPRWYRRRVSVWWWLESWRYAKFVLRELTSLGVAFFALITLWQVAALSAGPSAYTFFQHWLGTPLSIALHAVALIAILYHAVTWFHLAPRAMVVRLGGKRLPDAAIIAGNYAAWLAASALIAWFLLWS